MNSQMGFSSKLRRLTAPVCVTIRGELAIGAHLFAPHTSHEGGAVKARPYRCRAAIWTRSRIASSANVPETSSVASPIGLPSPHWSCGRAAAPFLFH